MLNAVDKHPAAHICRHPRDGRFRSGTLTTEFDTRRVQLTTQIRQGGKHVPALAGPLPAIGRIQAENEGILIPRVDPMKLPELI
jgi:hypothetical protein